MRARPISAMKDPVAAIEAFVRQPSVSTDPKYAAGMAGARDFLGGLLRDMGMDVEIVPTSGHPVVLGRRPGPAHWPHVVIYGHYDVQPPDPLELWESPPFEPTLRGERLYGRGVADNKAPLLVHVAAVSRLLSAEPDLPLRITFMVEGEEEIGSPGLPAVLKARKADLTGDFILLSDTLNPSEEQISITTGLRGMMCFELEVSGPDSDLHSGMYGGAVYNPIRALSELCASLHSPDGRVNVPGFYDAVIERAPWECAEIARLPLTAEAFARSIGIPCVDTPPGRTPMEAVRLEPTLEFNGIYGGYTGPGEKTIIPSRATAKISCRLVADQQPAQIRQLVFAALRERCPAGVRLTLRPGHDGPAYSVVPPGRPNTPPDQNPHLARAFAACEAAVLREFGQAPLYLPEGGSIPIIGTAREILGMDCIMLGMGTPENRLHAPNESFYLPTLEKGIAISMAILQAVAGIKS